MGQWGRKGCGTGWSERLNCGSAATKVSSSFSEWYRKPWSSELCQLEARGPGLCASTLTGLCRKMEPGARSALWAKSKAWGRTQLWTGSMQPAGQLVEWRHPGHSTKQPLAVPRVGAVTNQWYWAARIVDIRKGQWELHFMLVYSGKMQRRKITTRKKIKARVYVW